MRRDLMVFAKCETQPDPPLGEAKGKWRCSCGEEVVWTRDPIAVPKGWNAKTYAAMERTAFLEAVAVEVQKRQLTHQRLS